MIYRTFEQWKSGNVLEHGVPRTEHYSEDQLDLVEMGWNYGYDAGRAVEQALDKKAENARELGLDYEPVWDNLPSNKDVEDVMRMKRLNQLATPPAAQPAVPDAMTSADIQEHIEYVAGWNDCRQAILEMMK